MDTILKFDRVVLIKEFNEKIKKVGELYEIANVMEDAFLLREAKTKAAIGVISFKDFEEYFVKERDFEGWTNWTAITGFDGQSDAYYRTNGKRVQVKLIKDKIKAESCCHRDDEFNLYLGVQIAYLRCRNKALARLKDAYETSLKEINQEYAYNKNMIKKMSNSF